MLSAHCSRRVQLKFWSPREVHQWLAAPARAQLPAQQGGSASHGGAAGPAVCCHLVLQGCSRCSPARCAVICAMSPVCVTHGVKTR